VEEGLALALDDAFLALVVICLGISLDLVMVFYYYVIIISSSSVLCSELGGKYKGIHPHHSFHHCYLLHLIDQGFAKRSIRAYTLLA
jgi:hypothetical protein